MTVLNCGDATAGQIDEEVMRILKAAYQTAIDLLKGNLEALDKISAYLIENETITGKEFMDIFNEVRGITPETEKKPGELPAGGNLAAPESGKSSAQKGDNINDNVNIDKNSNHGDDGDFREVRKELPRGAFVNGRWDPDAINPAYIEDPVDKAKTSTDEDCDPSVCAGERLI